ncbi:MAG: hypothetical protein HC804_13625 [Anaerolineae bacterium]|nr:hypothetical protein [Anaerolineae bacterium]
MTWLHPGPVANFSALQPPVGDMQTAWELLAGQSTTLPELAELVYEEFTPATGLGHLAAVGRWAICGR